MNDELRFYKETLKNYLKNFNFGQIKKVDDYIGAGGFGVVYSCTSVDEKEKFAIKFEVYFLFEN
jgi:hypothetical protein